MTNKHSPHDFAYVPSDGKIPIYPWVEDCPDGIDPRSLDNPLTASYEETVSERINDGLKDRFDWGGDWIIVGSADPNDRFVDYDADLRNHVETLDDPEKLSFVEQYTTVFDSENGLHGLQFFTGDAAKKIDEFDTDTPPGLDIQGDSSNKLGVVGSPWHQDKYEIKHVGEKIEYRTDLDTKDGRTKLFSYAGEPILVEGRGSRSRNLDPVDWNGKLHTADLVDLAVGPNHAHPIHGSTTGNNFKIDDEGTWRCWRHNVTGNPYHIIMMEQGWLECGEIEHAYDWCGQYDKIATYAEENDLPKPPKKAESDYVASLNGLDDLTRRQLRSGIDPGRTINWYRRKTRSRFEEWLIDGYLQLPQGMGKSYNAVQIAKIAPVLHLCGTRRQRQKQLELARSEGLSAMDLPSHIHDSRLWNEYDEAKQLKDRGWPMYRIYKMIEHDCTPENDDYLAKRERLDNEHIDYLVGDPKHAEGMPKAIEGRIKFYDDVKPYEKHTKKYELDELGWLDELFDFIGVDERPSKAFRKYNWNYFKNKLPNTQEDPESDDLMDILNARASEFDTIDREAVLDATSNVPYQFVDVLRAFSEAWGGFGRSKWYTRRNKKIAWIPSTVNGADVDNGREVNITTIPKMNDARLVVTMSADAPTEMDRTFYEMAGRLPKGELLPINQPIDYEQFFDDMNVVVFQLSDKMRSHVGKGNADPEETKAALDAIEDEFGKCVYIDHLRATRDVDHVGVHHAKARSNNEFSDYHNVYIGGSTHYGYDYVGRWSGFCGLPSITVVKENGKEGEFVEDVPTEIKEAMLENAVGQAITRVGRDDNEPTFAFVNTRCIPAYFPVIDARNRLRRVSNGMKTVFNAIEGEMSAKQITSKVEISRSWVHTCLKRLVEMGFVRGSGDYGCDWSKIKSDLNSHLLQLTRARVQKLTMGRGPVATWEVTDDEVMLDTSDSTVQSTLADIGPPPESA